MSEVTFEKVREFVRSFCHAEAHITPETLLGADLGIKDKKLVSFLSAFIKKFEVNIDSQYELPGYYSRFNLNIFGVCYGIFYLAVIKAYRSWKLEISFFLISFLLFAIVLYIEIRKFMNNSTFLNKNIAAHKLDFNINDLVDMANGKGLFKKIE